MAFDGDQFVDDHNASTKGVQDMLDGCNNVRIGIPARCQAPGETNQ